jgi:hypothetical protein
MEQVLTGIFHASCVTRGRLPKPPRCLCREEGLSVQCVLDIGHEISLILEPNRKPDQAVADSGNRPCL